MMFTDLNDQMGKDGADYLVKQAIDLWFQPELERRKTAGRVGDDFRIRAAQALFPSGGGAIVRFNEEVHGVAHLKTTRPVEKGGEVYESDLDGLVQFDLLEEDLDHGHFTMLKGQNGWGVAFNFLTRRAFCLQLVQSARGHLDAARFLADRETIAPSIDNLFSACELASKAHLILHHMLRTPVKTHGPIQSGINYWAKLGNIDAAFVRLFNRLGQLRPGCRYEADDSPRTLLTVEDFQLVEAEIDLLESQCRQLRLGETPEDGAT
ncbi:hypothetical protein [Agrobacterium tumefaciens]|uniref:hypothetical protein n=1 Tax=Agrobacterium tumefaciens TaxID=358 RepID=UPI001572AB5D|nr:hypothetical protein [Agrobacterium tumefaciens]WCK21763.1 hypothetical protein G6M09_022520 [Agrobacterium tumefaciens]